MKPNSAQLPLPVRYQQDARRTVAVTVGEGSSSVAPCEIASIEYALAGDCKFAAAGRHRMASSGAVSPESLFCAGQLLRAASVLAAVTCAATGASAVSVMDASAGLCLRFQA